MAVLMDLIGGMSWIASPLGLIAAVVITAAVLSGIPGRVVVMISARMPR